VIVLKKAKPPITAADVFMAALKAAFVCVCFLAFIPAFNPVRSSELISKNASLFTCAVSYNAIGSNFIRALSARWTTQAPLSFLYAGAVTTIVAVIALGAAFCTSFGNIRFKRLCVKISAGAAVIGCVGISLLIYAHGLFETSNTPDRLGVTYPAGIPVFLYAFAIVLILSVSAFIKLPKAQKGTRFEIEPKYRLFLMILPFLVCVALFAYLPLWGWRYAFYDYRPGFDLTMSDFVGFKWFSYLFSNPATRADIVRVIKNTLAMSGIGIATSWLPMMFAIFLNEIKATRPKFIIQTMTTIPNFISWVLVYGVAFAIFSTEGFLNWALVNLNLIDAGTNYLMGSDHIWLKMWAWGTWKGLGWSAIIYIAGISSIDQEQYEAATVDGAGRFAKMWYITVPGLMPTFFVLLLLAIANILTNGLDQYLAFYNPGNRASIQVLDLFVYHLGLASQSNSSIPLATVIGMLKSIISVTLLFAANAASKRIRGESIV